jgi:hypothetical protein
MPISITLQSRLLAARSLTQLYNNNIYARMGLVDYMPEQFEVGDTAQIRRAKRRTAYTFDPRTQTMILEEGEFMGGSVTLDNLAYTAFPVYVSDPRKSVELYIEETGRTCGEAVAENADRYIYNRAFRTYLPTVGAVEVGDTSPLYIVAAESSTGEFADLTNTHLASSREVLNRNNVPQGNRFAALAPTASTNFMLDSTSQNNYVTVGAGGTQIYQNGLTPGVAVSRYGFNVMESNTIDGQSATLDLDSAASAQATLAIAAVAADTTKFFHADITGQVPIGAIDITLTTGTALTAGVAVGKIARIGVVGQRSKGYGVILRVNSTAPTAPVITLLLCSPAGKRLDASKVIVGTDVFSIPEIPSVSHAHHQEALIIANRNMIIPEAGDGAVGIAMEMYGLAMNLYRGSFNISRLRSERAITNLCGAKCTDWRKGNLILSL